jgi:hypothetical protein
MGDDIWMMTRTEYRVSCYQNFWKPRELVKAEDVSVYGRKTLTKLRWYSEAETMDEEELSRRKALEGVPSRA